MPKNPVWKYLDQYEDTSVKFIIATLLVVVGFLYIDGNRKFNEMRYEKDLLASDIANQCNEELKLCQNKVDSINAIRLEDALKYKDKFFNLLSNYRKTEKQLNKTLGDAQNTLKKISE